jgi:hypothetical protein
MTGTAAGSMFTTNLPKGKDRDHRHWSPQHPTASPHLPNRARHTPPAPALSGGTGGGVVVQTARSTHHLPRRQHPDHGARGEPRREGGSHGYHEGHSATHDQGCQRGLDDGGRPHRVG